MAGHTSQNKPSNSPEPYGLPPKKEGGLTEYLKGKLKVWAIALPILLALGLVYHFISTSSQKNIQATSLKDLSAVCKGGSVANVSDTAKPYKVAAFSKASGTGEGWDVIGLLQNAPYTVQSGKFKETNVVVCLSEDSSKREKTKTCTFQQGTMDYYATKYKAVAYEAKSGKKLAELGEIDAPADTCPSVATYNKKSPKVIAKPDSEESDALDKLVAEFAE